MQKLAYRRCQLCVLFYIFKNTVAKYFVLNIYKMFK